MSNLFTAVTALLLACPLSAKAETTLPASVPAQQIISRIESELNEAQRLVESFSGTALTEIDRAELKIAVTDRLISNCAPTLEIVSRLPEREVNDILRALSTDIADQRYGLRLGHALFTKLAQQPGQKARATQASADLDQLAWWNIGTAAFALRESARALRNDIETRSQNSPELHQRLQNLTEGLSTMGRQLEFSEARTPLGSDIRTTAVMDWEDASRDLLLARLTISMGR